MSKPFSYWVRLPLVATLCALTTFSPALAGKWVERFLNRDSSSKCEIVVPACPPAPCAPVEVGCSTTVVCPPDPCACEPTAVVDSPAPAPAVQTPAADGSKPATNPPATESQQPKSVPLTPIQPAQEPKVVDPEPGLIVPANPPVQPIVPADIIPAQPLPADPPPVPAVADPIPADPVPADPIPADPVPVQPALEMPAEPKQPANPPVADEGDLFGDPPAEEPKANEEKKPEEDMGDLFGDAPAEAEPAKPADDLAKPADDPLPPADAPAEQPMDDLFGDGKPADANGDANADADAKPDDAAPAKDPLDDLFGGDDKPAPAAEDKKPAGDELDALFGNGDNKPAEDPAPAADPAPADDAKGLDDIFGKPVSQQEPAAKDADLDSLFAPENVEKNAAPKAPETNNDQGELDALFGVGSFTPPAQFNGAEYKTWVDNTGTYKVKARLAVIYNDKVKLLKENGKFTTVPLGRLSDADFNYVQWVATNLTVDKSTKFVKKETEANATESVR